MDLVEYLSLLGQMHVLKKKIERLEPTIVKELSGMGWSQEQISLFMKIGKVNINKFLRGRNPRRFQRFQEVSQK